MNKYNPNNFLNSNRFDVIFKLLYVKSYISNENYTFFKNLYLDHIKAINYFVENDGSGKIGPDEFIIRFNSLIDNINSNSNVDIYLSKDGYLVDGSHRLAICICKNIDVNIVHTNKPNINLSYNFFEKSDIDIDYLNFVLIEYLNQKNTFNVLFNWPNGYNQENYNYISNHGIIVYYKRFYLSEFGKFNLFKVLYRNETWLDKANNYIGLYNKINTCFGNNSFFDIYIIENCTDFFNLKNNLRNLLNIGKHSFHSCDDYISSTRTLKYLLNQNTFKLLNSNIIENPSDWFCELFENFKFFYIKQDINLDNICLIGGSVLDICNIRKTRDIDFVSTVDIQDNFYKEFSCYNSEYTSLGFDINDLVINPKNYFFYEGIKFMSLSNLILYKFKRNYTKDKEDIILINSHINLYDSNNFNYRQKNNYQFNLNYYFKFIALKIRYYIYKYFLLSSFKNLFINFTKNIYHKLLFYFQYFYFLFYYPNVKILKSNNVYNSQYGQDYYIKNILSTLNKQISGDIVEIGANHPIYNNNSFLFYNDFKTISIDPINYSEIYKKLRPRTIFANYGVSDHEGDMNFYFVNKTSNWEDQMSSFKRPSSKFLYTEKKIIIKTLNNILENYNISKVSILFIDVEGHEYNILRNFNFNLYQPDIICIENKIFGNKIRNILKHNNYLFYNRIFTSDDIFINETLLK